VTLVIRRPVGVFVGLAAAAVLLTACSSGPSQVGSAVIVGDTSVSVNQVQQELNTLVANEPTVQQAQQQGKLDQIMSIVVTNHVRHALITHVAAQDNLNVPDAQVDQQISAAGGPAKLTSQLFVSQADVRSAVKDLLLETALARKTADSLTVRFGYLQVATRPEAIKDAQTIAANPNALNSLAQSANAAVQAQGGQSAVAAPDTTLSGTQYLQVVAQNQQAAQQQGVTYNLNLSPVFGAPANSVVVFEFDPDPSQQPMWFVALVKSHSTSTTPPPAGSSAANDQDLATLRALGDSLLGPVAKQIGVQISPRYGTWDPVDGQVAPVNSQTSGEVFPVHAKP
jgi:hypothetical protein